MANEIIEAALASVLEEMERSRKMQDEQKAVQGKLLETMTGIEARLSEMQQPAQQPLDIIPIEVAITKGIANLQKSIEAQPKTIKKEHRILLFPEHGAREYYRLVFGRLFFWLTIIILSTYLFALGKQTVQSWSIIHSQEKELNECKDYVHYLLTKEKLKTKNGH